MNDLVSIIICAYNSELYLERAIKSVISQTYQNIELILIDDGSNDGTAQICDRYSAKYKNIKTFHKQNGGVSDARNYGIKKATGEYISFLDADDQYLEDYVQKLLDSSLKYNTKMSVCGFYVIKNNGCYLKSGTVEKECVLNRDSFIKEYIKNDKLTSHLWGKLYKKEMFNSIVHPLGKVYEDLFVMPQLIEQCDYISFVPECLINYYYNPASITNSHNIDFEIDAFEASMIKFKKYALDDYSYKCLVREPIEIAIRIKKYSLKNKTKKYKEKRKEIDKFIREASLNKNTYSVLNIKYKICLLFSFMIIW